MSTLADEDGGSGDRPAQEQEAPEPGGWRSEIRRYRPRLVDGVMALAAVATAVLWSGGVTSERLVVIVMTWLVLWVWRLGSEGSKLWAVFIAAITVFVVLSGVPHVAQRMARNCTTDVATQLLEDEVVTSIDDVSYAAHGRYSSGEVRQPNPGRCGLLSWRHGAVIDINEYSRSQDPSAPLALAVVLFDSGPPHLNPLTYTEHGYVFSPDQEPTTCRDVAGRPNANNGYASCTVRSVGDDWFWYVAENSAD